MAMVSRDGGGEEIRCRGREEAAIESGTGETRVRADAGLFAAERLVGEIRRKQHEIAGMGRAEVLAFEARLRALRLRVLQRIREEEEKAAGAAAEDQPPPETGQMLAGGVASNISSGS